MKLTILCGSHIRSERGIAYCISMLNSWYENDPLTKLIISISFENEVFRSWFYSALSILCIYLYNKLDYKLKINKFLEIVDRDKKYSQFEHYNLLVQKLKEDRYSMNNWILFTDDDDIWHTSRMSIYYNHIDSIIGSKFQCVLCRISAESKIENNHEYSNNEDVNIGIINGDIIIKRNVGEYRFLCVKFFLLCNFFDRATKELCNNKFADLYFFEFIIKNYHFDIIDNIPSNIWVYFYRNNKNKPKLPSAFLFCPDLLKIYQDEPETEKHFIASTLQNIEYFGAKNWDIFTDNGLNIKLFEQCVLRELKNTQEIFKYRPYTKIVEYTKHPYFRQLTKCFF